MANFAASEREFIIARTLQPSESADQIRPQSLKKYLRIGDPYQYPHIID